MNKNNVKGLTMLAMATLSSSSIPVFSKKLLEFMPSYHFIFMWMIFSLFYAMIFAGFTGYKRVFKQIYTERKNVFLVGICACGWVGLFFQGLKMLDPTVTGFLFNFRAVWGILIGIFVLGERYRTMEYAGMVVIFIGSIVITYTSRNPENMVGVMLVVTSSLCFVLTNFFVKRFVHKMGPASSLLARLFLPALLFLPFVFDPQPFWGYLNTETLILFIVGTLVGPFLSSYLIFSSLKYIGIGLHTIFQSVSIFFTALFSAVFLGMLPSPQQFVGGLVIVSGVILIGIQTIYSGRKARNNV